MRTTLPVVVLVTVSVLGFALCIIVLNFLKPSDSKLQSSSNMARKVVADRGAQVIKNVDFEIFGKVQGVFFRKHTRITARQYGLVGWVQNTNHRTVIGQAQGPPDKLEKMKEWLRKTGSPKSSITKAEFRNEKIINSLNFEEFEIIH